MQESRATSISRVFCAKVAPRKVNAAAPVTFLPRNSSKLVAICLNQSCPVLQRPSVDSVVRFVIKSHVSPVYHLLLPNVTSKVVGHLTSICKSLGFFVFYVPDSASHFESDSKIENSMSWLYT